MGLSLGSEFDDPKTQGLLALGLGLLGSRGNFAQSLAQGGQQGLLGYQQGMQQKSQRENEAIRRQLLVAQIGEKKAQAQEREAQAQAMQRKQQQALLFQQALTPQGVTGGQAASAPGGPSPGNAAMIGARQPTDWAGLAQRFPDQVDLIKKLAESQDFGRPEVARTMTGMVNGREQSQQFDKFGRPVGAGMEQYRAPIQTDEGGKIGFRDPYSLATLMGVNKTNSPDALLSASTARRGQDMTDDRAREANARVGGNSRTGPMSVTLQKELLESDDTVQSAGGVIRSLTTALKQNDSAYSGYFAKPRAVLRSNLPGQSQSADATIDIDNLMTGQGLESLKSIFGAAPTEGERKILMDMQASVDKTPAQRKAIIERAVAAAERRGAYAARKAQAIRDGSYLTEGIPPLEAAVSPGKGSSLNDLLTKYGN